MILKVDGGHHLPHHHLPHHHHQQKSPQNHQQRTNHLPQKIQLRLRKQVSDRFFFSSASDSELRPCTPLPFLSSTEAQKLSVCLVSSPDRRRPVPGQRRHKLTSACFCDVRRNGQTELLGQRGQRLYTVGSPSCCQAAAFAEPFYLHADSGAQRCSKGALSKALLDRASTQ